MRLRCARCGSLLAFHTVGDNYLIIVEVHTCDLNVPDAAPTGGIR